VRQNVIRTRIKGNINDKMKEDDDDGGKHVNFYEMEPIVPEAEAVPRLISSSSKKNVHIADTSVLMVSLAATMKNGIDFCNDTDREVDEGHGAASRVAVAFARQSRLAVSLSLYVCVLLVELLVLALSLMYPTTTSFVTSSA
jgi:hypothetical protein